MTTQRAERIYRIACDYHDEVSLSTLDRDRIASIQRELDAEHDEAVAECAQACGQYAEKYGSHETRYWILETVIRALKRSAPSPAPRTEAEANTNDPLATMGARLQTATDQIRVLNTRLGDVERWKERIEARLSRISAAAKGDSTT